MTALEVTVYVGVFTLVMLAIVTSVQYFYRSNNYTIQQADAVASAQRGIDRTVREIREAAYSSEGAYPIVSFGPNDFVLYSDVDSDPFIERIHYYVQSTSLMRGVVDPSGDPPAYTGSETASTLSTNVRNLDNALPIFTYYDKNGAQITNYANASDVRFVSISLQIDVDPSRSPTPILIRSSAALRNIQ